MRACLTLSATLLATPALADVPVVVTDTPVVHSLVSQVMGDLGQPVVLLEPGADPHSFQLRPSQARALGEAALVFWVGEELTPWLARAIDTMATGGTSVPLLHEDGVRTQGFGREDHDGEHGHDDHGHDEAHDHGDGHGHDDAHDHDHEGADPHAWLDPENAKVWLTAIAAHLSGTDPENAATYAENAAAASAGIDAAAGQVVEILAPAKDAPIVTFHDAYGYFEHAFGVNVAGSIALGDATAPGAQRLRALQDQIGVDRIACVFREPQHDASIAEAVAADAGIGLGTLDPSGSTLPYGRDLYGLLLTGLARSIADCVSGPA